MSDYEKLKQELKALRNKCKELEDKIEQAKQDDEPIERVPKNDMYFLIGITSGKAVVYKEREDYCDIDADRFYNNNYFKTSERAQKIVDKINFLLKLERLHDTLCPDFVPDWDDFNSYKYMILYDHDHKIYKYIYCYTAEHRTLAYFPTEEIAKKVCDILNKECGEEVTT